MFTSRCTNRRCSSHHWTAAIIHNNTIIIFYLRAQSHYRGRNDIIAVLLLSSVFIIQCRHGSLLNSAAQHRLKRERDEWSCLSLPQTNSTVKRALIASTACSLAPVSHTGPFLQHTHVTKQQIYNKQINTQTDTSPSGFSQRNPEHHVNQKIIQI